MRFAVTQSSVTSDVRLRRRHTLDKPQSIKMLVA